MSIEMVREQVFKFLSSSEAEVMAVKGEWGVGKTYSWRKFLLEAKSENKIEFERYSYVSLFGVNSLEALKYSIFENTIKRDVIGAEATLETLKDNVANIIEELRGGVTSNALKPSATKANGVLSWSQVEALARKALNYVRKAPLAALSIEAISFLSLRDTVVCIDDLERKGGELEVKDIFGLVMQLKEQRNCKVILLLNSSEEGIEEYYKYQEKVIDYELTFRPTPEECALIAYSEDKNYHSRLAELTTSLGIKNIRVLKKIERLLLLMEPSYRWWLGRRSF